MSILDEIIAEIVPTTRTVRVAGHEFTFACIGVTAWRELSDKCQPTDEQLQAGRRMGERVDHNPDTFPPLAMAESCTEIDGERAQGTVDRFKRLATKLGLADWQRLWAACLAANLGASDVPPAAPEETRPSGTQDQPDVAETADPGGASAAA